MHRKLILAALTAATLAGCGSSSIRTVTTVQTVTTAQPSTASTASQIHLAPSPGGTFCHVVLQGHNAEIVFNSAAMNIEPLCADWVSKAAAGGELWDENGPIPSLNVSRICALSDNGGVATAEVWDQGGAIYGQQACTALLASGWTEQQTPSVPYSG